ncbi:MAG: prohibitin family protein [Bacteroidia bacterium]|nr:prohibitin family protein [Bacteroidia bacterium]
MLLILLGIVVTLAVAFAGKQSPLARFKSPARLAGLILIALGVVTSCFVQIGPGELGVQTLFGKVQEGTLPSGLHFVNPLVEVVTFDVRTQNYTMSAVHEEGEQYGDDAIRVLTSDGLEVVIDLTVLFRVEADKAPRILQEIGSEYINVIVRPVARTKIRDNAVYYDAVSLYSTKREEFQDRIFKNIENEFSQRGLVLEELLIRNINLPQSVKATIESKINAEQEAQKMVFVLDKEKQEAERKRVEAQGISDYQRIMSASLSDRQLQYELIKAQKEIATSPNAKIIILGDSKTPFIIGNN